MNIKRIVLILFFILAYRLSIAAEITIDNHYDYSNIIISGIIAQGDSNKFKAILEETLLSGKLVEFVKISSSGGDVIESMKIGELIREFMIATLAPLASNDKKNLCPWMGDPKKYTNEQCDCASACFLIWSAGVERNGNIVGLHRPYFSKKYFKGLSGTQAQKKYEEMSLTVRNYMIKMGVPNMLVEKSFSVGSEEVFYPDIITLESMRKVPFFDEWIAASCGVISKEEEDKFLLFSYLKLSEEKLSKVDEILYDALRKRRSENQTCKNQKVRAHQQSKIREFNKR